MSSCITVWLAAYIFSNLVLDESTDTAQLLLYVGLRAVYINFEITLQELRELASLQGCATGLDIFYFGVLVLRLEKFG